MHDARLIDQLAGTGLLKLALIPQAGDKLRLGPANVRICYFGTNTHIGKQAGRQVGRQASSCGAEIIRDPLLAHRRQRASLSPVCPYLAAQADRHANSRRERVS